MLAKKRLFLIIALLYIFYTIFPLFADTFRIPVWLPSMATFFIMLILYPQAFFNKTFYWFLVYALVLFIYLMLGRRLTIGIGSSAENKKIIIEYAFILPALSIFSILNYLDDGDLTQKLAKWSIGMLFVSFILVVPLMQRYGSIRAALIEENAEDISVPGLPSYSLMHAYTLFLPMFCYGTKVFKDIKKWLMLMGLFVMCFVVYDTFVTTSLLVMIGVLLFTILYSEKNKGLSWIVFFILLIIIFVLYRFGFFVSFIDWIMPAFEGTAVEFKLNDFKQSMQIGQLTGAHIVGRQNLHYISWNSFFINPFFGNSIAGGHSVLIDRFGGMGVVTGIPFLMIFISSIQQLTKIYHTKMAKIFYWVGVIISFVYLYEKGLWGKENWLVYLVLMPMGILFFEQKSLEYKSKNNEQ